MYCVSSSVRHRCAPIGVAAWLVAVVSAAAGGRLSAAEVQLNPSADALLFAGEAGSNYGGAGQLAVSDAGRPEGEYQSLLRFDAAAAKASFDAAFGPGQWRLQSAALRLGTSNPSNALFNANLAGPVAVSWMGNDSWVEGTGTPTGPANQGVTFNLLPSLLSAEDQPLGTLNFPGGNSGANTYELDLGAGFIADVQSGQPLSMRLYAGAGMAVAYNFSSRSFQAVANRPVLTLSAVAIPEPAAGLAVAGFAGAVIARRRRGQCLR